MQTKPVTEFSRGGKSNDGLQAWCKGCFKERYQHTKVRHSKLVADRKKIVIEENRERLKEYLSTRSCTDCKTTNWIVLEFDHVNDDKEDSVSRLLAGGYYWKRIMREIAKCEVVCANCHRIRTYTRAGSWRLGV